MPGKPPGPNGDFEGPKTESDGPKMPFGLPVSMGPILGVAMGPMGFAVGQ